MTITNKKKGASNGGAYLISRTIKSSNGTDWGNSIRNDTKRLLVSFNTKDELELRPTSDSDAQKEKDSETFKISEIIECYAGDLKDFNNILIVEVYKNQTKEEIVLQFENEQEFRRTLFTYKYFKMRNRLTSSSSESSSEGSPSPSPSTKSRSSIDYSNAEGPISNYIKTFDYSPNLNNHQFSKKYDMNNDSYSYKSLDYVPSQKIKLSLLDQKENIDINDNAKSLKSNKPEYDLMHVTDINGVTHMSVESKTDLGEIDGLIYTDVEYDSVEFGNGNSSSSEVLDVPQKPQRRKQLLRRIKGKAPPPPGSEAEIIKGQVVRAERSEKQAKEATNFAPRTVPPLTKGLMGSNGYESDREEWRSRSTFSSSAFHSLARPARRALAAYYRLSSTSSPQNAPQVPPVVTMRKPSPRNPRNLQNLEYPKNYQSIHPDYILISPLHSENKRSQHAQPVHQDFKKNDMSFQKQEYKYGKLLFNKDYKKNPLGGSMTYLNISNRLYGLTDKLKEFSTSQQNKQQSWMGKNEKERKDKGLLKPVIKKSPTTEGSKRPVVRTCSTEPPKKVTFSAFATVQVV